MTMTMTSPLRGPKSPEGGGFAAAHLLARRAGYGARPSGLQGATHRAGARQPCGLPWTPETTAAPGARKSGQAQACPRAARGAQTPRWRAHELPERQSTAEPAFDSHKKRENYKPRVMSRIK
jgi:hypothetical protein